MADFYTSRDVAKRFGVTPETVRNWEKDGRIPPASRTPGGHRRYSEEHFAAIDRIYRKQ